MYPFDLNQLGELFRHVGREDIPWHPTKTLSEISAIYCEGGNETFVLFGDIFTPTASGSHGSISRGLRSLVASKNNCACEDRDIVVCRREEGAVYVLQLKLDFT